ncbi:hypothetical protein L2Z47_00125 [Acinetobacter baumannii]|uniref:hypothetical protein n=1 Tax=Acinetobacter baumannii TaxID=470 RepID=UPI000D6E7641|nr:hypothetical protein [Acinetobacter baumannii]MBD0088339.1 hypothetical protein [Acinetobacter baumannii]MBU0407003.1 hypothetical protein [Acinetobacter baumannii]MDV4311294.1 hypothetical protein [Acinetobacter baumannii]UMN02232.1 hypothetical protein L2Z47_00125 [Acinetobacter baumannii]HAV3045855.1 hypothetical protein [Acinetobacter baumannii]
MLFNGSEELIVIYQNGDKGILKSCRIDNEERIFTSDSTEGLNIGDRLIKNLQNGSKREYLIKIVKDGINMSGHREIKVQQI